MLDINLLRTNPDLVRENIRKKFQDSKLPLVDEVITLDREYREALQRAGLSERHARALLRLTGEERQMAAARQAAKNSLQLSFQVLTWREEPMKLSMGKP